MNALAENVYDCCPPTCQSSFQGGGNFVRGCNLFRVTPHRGSELRQILRAELPHFQSGFLFAPVGFVEDLRFLA